MKKYTHTPKDLPQLTKIMSYCAESSAMDQTITSRRLSAYEELTSRCNGLGACLWFPLYDDFMSVTGLYGYDAQSLPFPLVDTVNRVV